MAALTRHIHHGNETEKYPLDIIFALNFAAQPGTPVEDYSVGFAVGFGTAQAALLFAIGVKEICCAGGAGVPDIVKPHLLKVLRMRFVHQTDRSLSDMVHRSIGSKMAASERQRPNIIQLSVAFGRVIEQSACSSARKSRTDQLQECLVSYNKSQKVGGCRILPDERSAIKLLSYMSDDFVRTLRRQWSRYRVPDSAVPMALLASKFLQRTNELPVSNKENTLWYGILSPSASKYDLWLKRVIGRFEARMEDAVQRNVRPLAHLQRDSDPVQVWQTCCLWDYLQEQLQKIHSAARMKDLNDAFARGSSLHLPFALCKFSRHSIFILRLLLVRGRLTGSFTTRSS